MKIFTKPAVLLVAFLFGSYVHAQTGNFEGFAAGFGGSTLSTNVKLSALATLTALITLADSSFSGA